jgi:phosphate uptake regulator
MTLTTSHGLLGGTMTSGMFDAPTDRPSARQLMQIVLSNRAIERDADHIRFSVAWYFPWRGSDDNALVNALQTDEPPPSINARFQS